MLPTSRVVAALVEGLGPRTRREQGDNIGCGTGRRTRPDARAGRSRARAGRDTPRVSGDHAGRRGGCGDRAHRARPRPDPGSSRIRFSSSARSRWFSASSRRIRSSRRSCGVSLTSVPAGTPRTFSIRATVSSVGVVASSSRVYRLTLVSHESQLCRGSAS